MDNQVSPVREGSVRLESCLELAAACRRKHDRVEEDMACSLAREMNLNGNLSVFLAAAAAASPALLAQAGLA
jgi:hypothetical protein